MEAKKRIEWIDLAKGFCILLVMFWHTKELYSNRGFTDRNHFLYMGTYFRMPLYFFLSGLFFKKYDCYVDFLHRKTNKLFVPYLVFALLGVAFSFIWPEKMPRQCDWHRLYPFLPIWFLWCLFMMNNLFYLIKTLARDNDVLVYITVCALGLIGYFSGENSIYVLHLRSALTAMPFFVAGYAVRNNTQFLTTEAGKRDIALALGALALLYALTVYNGHAPIFYVSNNYEVSIWSLYIGGALGVYAVLTLAKAIKRLPVISYLGRYSIVVLITHYPIIYLFPKNWNRMLFRGFEGWCAVEELVLLACIEVPIIALCTHYLPWIFAQKDLITLKPSTQNESI